MRSVPKDAEWFLCLCRGDLFPRLYDFCTKWKMSFMISAPKSFLTQYIYIAMICRFLWWILTDLLFFQQIIKREIRFIFIDKSWRFFVNFINFVVHSHTMGHPKKRAVTKLRCRLVRTQMFLKTEHFVPPWQNFSQWECMGAQTFWNSPLHQRRYEEKWSTLYRKGILPPPLKNEALFQEMITRNKIWISKTTFNMCESLLKLHLH